MVREKGWKPLPASLKVLFVILVLSMFISSFSVDSVFKVGYFILGFHIFGIGAIISLAIFSVFGMIVFLLALWNRLAWTWKYGVAYFTFFILNQLLFLPRLPKKLESLISQIPATVPPGTIEAMYSSAIMGLLFGVALNVVYLIIIYRTRSYFELEEG